MSSSPRSYLWPSIAALVGVSLLLIALPASWKPWAPSFLNPTLHLGLDLQGGTQLDFRISEAEMEKQIEQLQREIEELEETSGSPDEIAEKQAQIANIRILQGGIVEAIRTVLERRVNSLGVSEAVITPSFYGEEKHLLVECPGIIDIQKCIATIGKTILLEFKEQATGEEDEEHIEKMRALAQKAWGRISGSGESLKTVSEDLGTTLGVLSLDQKFYQDELPKGLESIWKKKPGDPVLREEVELDPIEKNGEQLPHRGIILAEVTGEKEEADRTIADPEEAMAYLAETESGLKFQKHSVEPMSKLDLGYQSLLPSLQPQTLLKGTNAKGEKSILYVTERNDAREELRASHILIAYRNAARATPDVTRLKEEARLLAQELREKFDRGAGFALLVREYSDGPSAQDGGSLGAISRGAMPPTFERAAFALKKVGDISEVVETEFGFHIIRLDAPGREISGTLSYVELLTSGENAEALQTSIFERLQQRSIVRREEQLPLRALLFSFLPTGWKDTPLDGKHFRRATVTSDPLTGVPVVQIVFDGEGGELFHELTKKNVGQPIAIFVGGELVSAPTVQSAIAGGTAIITGSRNFDEANALAQDLNTGAIPAPVHLVGQTTVEATLGQVALQQSLKAALFGFILVSAYMIWYYRVLGIIATIALVVYALLFTAILKLPLFLFTGQYIVLTLAGVAGIILSVGMAVDANVLIFERMKEEIAKGKLLSTAADTGFKRSWPAIRDSNASTLLTAAILFIIGTSIVRGFSVTLSIGILLSMFTATIVTRWLISLLFASPLAQNLAAFGVTLPSATQQGVEPQGK